MASNFNDISGENHMEREEASQNVVSQDLETAVILQNASPDASPTADALVLPRDQILSAAPQSKHQAESSASLAAKSYQTSFKLFHHQGDQDYVLEMEELETGKKNAHLLSLIQTKEKWAVEKEKVSLQQQDMHPVDQIANQPFQPRYTLSLQERLEGWIVKEKFRSGSRHVDKTYIHENVPRHFRSLKEAAPFILYGCRKEDIQHAKEISEKQETVKEFFNEAYSNFYNYYAENDAESSLATISNKDGVNVPDD